MTTPGENWVTLDSLAFAWSKHVATTCSQPPARMHSERGADSAGVMTAPPPSKIEVVLTCGVPAGDQNTGRREQG